MTPVAIVLAVLVVFVSTGFANEEQAKSNQRLMLVPRGEPQKPPPKAAARKAAPATEPVVPAAAPATTASKKSRPIERDIENANAEVYLNMIDRAQYDVNKFANDVEKCEMCSVYHSADAADRGKEATSATKACEAAWADFYGCNPEVEVRMTFGYFDSEATDLTEDRAMRASMVEMVTKPCNEKRANVKACGFIADKDDADVFRREVVGPSGITQTIKLRLTASSYSSIDRVNRTLLSEQTAQSEKARQAYRSGHCEAAWNVYIGHARKGGGPSFVPAYRRADGMIDYPKHQAKREGYDELGSALVDAMTCPNRSKIESVLACDADELFTPMMLRSSGESVGVMNANVDVQKPEHFLARAYAGLDSVMWRWCSPAFDKATVGIEPGVKPFLKLKNFYERFQKPGVEAKKCD